MEPTDSPAITGIFYLMTRALTDAAAGEEVALNALEEEEKWWVSCHAHGCIAVGRVG